MTFLCPGARRDETVPPDGTAGVAEPMDVDAATGATGTPEPKPDDVDAGGPAATDPVPPCHVECVLGLPISRPSQCSAVVGN